MCTGTISFISAVVPMQKQNVHAQFSHISGAINAMYVQFHGERVGCTHNASLTPQVN